MKTPKPLAIAQTAASIATAASDANIRLAAPLAEIVDAAIEISEADFGNIQLLDPATHSLTIVAQRGFPSWWLEFWDKVGTGHGVCGTALERGQRVIVEDVEKSPLFIGSPALDIQRRAGVRAVQSTPIVSRAGKPLGMFSTHYKTPHCPDQRTLRLLDLLASQAADIIERERAEETIRLYERLQASEARLQEAQRIAHIGSWELNLTDNALVWSKEVYRIFEIDPVQFSGSYETFLNNVHPDDRAAVNSAFTNALHTLQPYSIDHRLLLADGRVKYVHEQCETQYIDGKPVRSVGTVQDITERKRVENDLQKSEERLRELFQQASDGIFIADPDGRYIDVNDAGCRMLGYTREEIIRKSIIDLIPAQDVDRLWLSKQQLLRGRIQCTEWALRRKDGSYLPVEVSAKFLADGRWQGFVRDISERKQIERQLHQAAIVFDNTIDAILITDANRNIVAINPAYTNITGFTAEEVLGKNPRLHKSDRHDSAFYDELWQTLAEKGQWQGEIWNRRKNGEVYAAWENISVVKDERGLVTNYISVLSDISLIKQAEEQLWQLAHHDALTGLPNRVAFAANMEQALQRAKRREQKMALLFLDLDRFKLINDTMGHAAGDKLLQTVGTRLKRCVRAEDTVARLGGDEFTVIVQELTHAEDAATLAAKIITAIAEPMLLEDRKVVTSVSIGISVYPDDASNVEDLAKAADAAMYRAKERGRHTYEFYTRELTARAQEHLAMEEALRQALARNEFVLHYQPLLELRQHKIVGVEALLRWQHPRKGLIGPDEFLTVAEESDLILPIGDWVLREACRQAALWRAAGKPSLRIAINLSGRQILHDGLVNTIQDVLIFPRNSGHLGKRTLCRLHHFIDQW